MGKVFLTDQAQKELLKPPSREKLKIQKKLLTLESNAFVGKKLVGKLSGFYSLKIWPYRAVYLVKENKEIWVVHILHRQGVYKKLIS